MMEERKGIGENAQIGRKCQDTLISTGDLTPWGNGLRGTAKVKFGKVARGKEEVVRSSEKISTRGGRGR